LVPPTGEAIEKGGDKMQEAGMVDLRPQIRAALLAVESDVPFAVRQRWSSEAAGGVCVTYAEVENRSTECPVVDFVSYQVDVWAPERAQVTELAALVNTALLELGLKRLSRTESVTKDGLRRCELTGDQSENFGKKNDYRQIPHDRQYIHNNRLFSIVKSLCIYVTPDLTFCQTKNPGSPGFSLSKNYISI
jgi:hypothetical protein